MKSSSRKPNSFFQFKQFRIEQASSAMKVTTEACILGGLVPTSLKPTSILDIGTGTGLLALMMAQKFPMAQIHAVELDKLASQQATENVKSSPWSDRIQVFQSKIQSFQLNAYDLILCNPPFYNQSLQSVNTRINAVRHDNSLGQEELAKEIALRLSLDGTAFILYPPKEALQFIKKAIDFGLSPELKINLFNEENDQMGRPFRIITKFTKSQTSLEERDFYIRKDNEYSDAFIDILKDYYLHL